MANRARQARPVPNIAGRVINNPLPFGGPSAQLFGSNTHTLANARQNPVVTDEQWQANIKRQANEIVRGQRGQVDLFYLPPPNTDSFEAESVADFWEYIRNKLEGDLPAHADPANNTSAGCHLQNILCNQLLVSHPCLLIQITVPKKINLVENHVK